MSLVLVGQNGRSQVHDKGVFDVGFANGALQETARLCITGLALGRVWWFTQVLLDGPDIVGVVRDRLC